MKQLVPHFYYSAIRSAIPYAYKISTPRIRGSQNSVYIADDETDKYVCKFNHRELADKNAVVGCLARNNGINVPQISVHSYRDYWFETYKMLPGHTLYEQVRNGMDDEKINIAYHDIVHEFAKMTDLNMRSVSNIKYGNIHRVARANISDVNNPALGATFGTIVRAMNIGRDKDTGLYHAGITPKNTIVFDNGHLSGIVDLDEMAVCNKNYAFAMMAAKYNQMGFDERELIEYYEKISGDKLERRRISALINMTNMGKHMLWCAAQFGKTK